MTIVNCPRCRDEVTVPARASRKALVRCPLCLEEYLLGEAVELPPALIVLDGSADGDELALVGAGVASDTAQAGGMELGGDEYRLSGGGFGAALDSRPSAGASLSPARPAVKGARPKRKEKSPVVEVMKVVVGGVVGCGLALLVLWWGFARDDFRLGPRIAPYAPWIVPAKFHGKPVAPDGQQTAANSTAGPSSASSTAPPPAKVGNGTNAGSGSVTDLPTDVQFPNPTTTADPLKIDDPLAPSADPALPLEPMPLGPLPDLTPPIETNPAPFNPEVKPGEPTLEPPATNEKPLPTAADFAKAVLAAADGYGKVNESTGQPAEVRKQLYTDMYLAASEVGRIVTYLSTSDADLIEHVDTLKTFLTGLAMQPGKVSALKALTDLNLPERKHDEGVLVAGVVQDFKAAGSMFECTTQAGKSLAETPVISATNPQDFCQPGDELLIVGRVVENPQKNIPGYEGEHKRVVLYGYSVKVPK